ncbi:MAG: TraR/DksA family transcriptional regulator [Candidatus Wildermuthbacteria bacterium]|nr:TraR/DksA family transcriptional regulator [Candidatus Wildermuthbacteria bacterium]
MNKQTLAQIHKSLAERKSQLERELSSFATKDSKPEGDWDTKYPSIPGANLEDSAGEVEEYSTNLPIEYSLETQLKQINKAIQKIQDESYGTCEDCKQGISQERLLANPEAEYCQECAAKHSF